MFSCGNSIRTNNDASKVHSFAIKLSRKGCRTKSGDGVLALYHWAIPRCYKVGGVGIEPTTSHSHNDNHHSIGSARWQVRIELTTSCATNKRSDQLSYCHSEYREIRTPIFRMWVTATRSQPYLPCTQTNHALSWIRTNTWTVLSRLPLPLRYKGDAGGRTRTCTETFLRRLPLPLRYTSKMLTPRFELGLC